MEKRKEHNQKIRLDADSQNADWLRSSWHLPPYKSDEFMDYLARTQSNLEEFRNLPIYRFAIEKGLIKDDEWIIESKK